jgi:hypothetical protein
MRTSPRRQRSIKVSLLDIYPPSFHGIPDPNAGNAIEDTQMLAPLVVDLHVSVELIPDVDSLAILGAPPPATMLVAEKHLVVEK